jgi:protein involved in polysaccharide export with SLBB domain
LESVIGPQNQPLPIQIPYPDALNQNIGVGYPFPVLEDGTIALPIANPIKVKGLSIIQAKKAIRDAYLEQNLLKEETVNKLIVTLYRPRQYRVLVVRQDSGALGAQYVQAYGSNSSKRGSGRVLELPAYENDVLTALTRSGGLPGNDAKNEVTIQRGVLKGEFNTMTTGPIPGIEQIRIPLRLRPGEPVPFKPNDVILENGDILFIQSRDTEVFYTAGLIPTFEWPLPRDSDLDVLEAVISTRGPVANGGLNQSNLSGTIISQGIGAPSPSQLTVLRKAPGNRQISIRVDLNRAMQDPRERILVQPGDVLVLQETLGESMTRYLITTLRFSFVSRILQTSSTSIFTNATGP